MEKMCRFVLSLTDGILSNVRSYYSQNIAPIGLNSREYPKYWGYSMLYDRSLKTD